MRKVAMFITLCAAATAWAQGPNNPANFDTAKARMTEMADKRLAILQEHKECISKAADTVALKACVKTERAKMKELRDQRKSN